MEPLDEVSVKLKAEVEIDLPDMVRIETCLCFLDGYIRGLVLSKGSDTTPDSVDQLAIKEIREELSKMRICSSPSPDKTSE